MLTLRCTHKLLGHLPVPLVARHSASSLPLPTTLLGDWYATVLFTRPTRLILSLSERSRLCVLVPARDSSSLLPRWRAAVEELLLALEIPEGRVRSELAQMQEIRLGPTRGGDATLSRSCLGSLNDFSFLAKSYLEDKVWSPQDLALRLSEVPCGPLKMDSPRNVTRRLLAKAYTQQESENAKV